MMVLGFSGFPSGLAVARTPSCTHRGDSEAGGGHGERDEVCCAVVAHSQTTTLERRVTASRHLHRRPRCVNGHDLLGLGGAGQQERGRRQDGGKEA